METIELARKLARKLRPKDIIYLCGELGSGKTTFTKGICLGLGVKDPVTSPSFVIASEYQGNLRISHIDLYRLKASDLATLPIEEYYISDGVTIIEWADRLPHFLQRCYKGIYISFFVKKRNKREIFIEDLRN
ncbi:MAG: tRNA (adenosine(37)-N6)-threonylcarbamoyltransferase complex ATPase subunit type 1 TsaE [candidate division WOR-3 bacterium]